MPDRFAPPDGRSRRAQRSTAPAGQPMLLRGVASLLALACAGATSMVVASAQGAPPDDPSSNGSAHAVVTLPEHGPDPGQPGQGNRGQGELHRHAGSSNTGGHNGQGGGMPSGLPGLAWGRPKIAVPGVLGGTPAGDDLAPAAETSVATPATGGETAGAAAEALSPARTLRAAGRPAPTPQHWPDVVVIPPATLPAPPAIRALSPGFPAGPLVILALGVLLFGGLLGLRIARRPG